MDSSAFNNGLPTPPWLPPAIVLTFLLALYGLGRMIGDVFA